MFEVKIWVLISQTINFFVLFWILNKFLFKPIGKVIEDRREEILRIKKETETAFDDAKVLKEKCQERLDNIKTEMDELKRQKLLETEDSVAKVIVNAKNKAETMKEEAELEILLEKQRAWIQMREDVVQLATEAAEKIIGESLSDEMHRKLINKSIEKLDKDLPDSKEETKETKTELPKEYAQSFFAKIDEKDLKPIYADLRAFVKIYNENTELHEIMDSPTIEPEKKLALINKVFASSIEKEVMEFVTSLINEKRTHILNKIAEEADLMYHDRKCIKGIRVRTKIPLTNSELTNLQKVLKKKFGTLEIEEVVDTNMVGGLIIQLDDLIVDDSIDLRVKQLRESMAKVKDTWKQQIADAPSLAII